MSTVRDTKTWFISVAKAINMGLANLSPETFDELDSRWERLKSTVMREVNATESQIDAMLETNLGPEAEKLFADLDKWYRSKGGEYIIAALDGKSIC